MAIPFAFTVCLCDISLKTSIDPIVFAAHTSIGLFFVLFSSVFLLYSICIFAFWVLVRRLQHGCSLCICGLCDIVTKRKSMSQDLPLRH